MVVSVAGIPEVSVEDIPEVSAEDIPEISAEDIWVVSVGATRVVSVGAGWAAATDSGFIPTKIVQPRSRGRIESAQKTTLKAYFATDTRHDDYRAGPTGPGRTGGPSHC